MKEANPHTGCRQIGAIKRLKDVKKFSDLRQKNIGKQKYNML